MPLTVAPPPRNGDAAQGSWCSTAPALAASDRAEAHHDATEPLPTLPASAAIARTMAAGVLLSAAALAIAATIVFVFAAVRLGAAGDARLALDGAAAIVVTAAMALACAAALSAPLWPWPARRPRTLALAAIVTAAWPLSGHALAAGAVAIVVVGLALTRDHRTPGGRRATSWRLAGALAVPAVAVAITGIALADLRPVRTGALRHAPAPEAAKPLETATPEPSRATEPRAAATPEASRATEPRATATPDAPDASKAPATAAPATSPGDTPATDAGTATAFVRDYYTALNERRYEDAWADLPPAVRKQFGGFGQWKRGYAQTVKSEPTNLATRADGHASIVSLRLVAHEKNCNRAQTFTVTWRLERVAGEWSVAAVRGSAVGSLACD